MGNRLNKERGLIKWIIIIGTSFTLFNEIEERKGSTYYEDPLYQSWFIQPVSHSTILINGNHQSQRAGINLDLLRVLMIMLSLQNLLMAKMPAFSSGDIGRLYWGQVKSISRNVLFLKPRTLLMLDVTEPGSKDADVTLLYQTAHLQELVPGNMFQNYERGIFPQYKPPCSSTCGCKSR